MRQMFVVMIIAGSAVTFAAHVLLFAFFFFQAHLTHGPASFVTHPFVMSEAFFTKASCEAVGTWPS
jgi:transcriptional regulator of nitric oxide reductase